MKQLTDFIVEIPNIIPEENLKEINSWLPTADWKDTTVARGDIRRDISRYTDLQSKSGRYVPQPTHEYIPGRGLMMIGGK